MVHLATLERTKSMLHIDASDHDADLELMIAAASEAIVAYLKRQVIEITTDSTTSPPETETFLDLEASPPVIPETVTLATIMLVGYWVRNPDGDPDKDFRPGYLPPPITAVLYPYRDPTLV